MELTRQGVIRPVQLPGVWQTLILTPGLHGFFSHSQPAGFVQREIRSSFTSFCAPIPVCASLFCMHQTVCSAHRWTEMEKSRKARLRVRPSSPNCSLISPLLQQRALTSTAREAVVDLNFKCYDDDDCTFVGIGSWARRLEWDRPRPSLLGGVMEQKRGWEDVGDYISSSAPPWWMILPAFKTCGLIFFKIEICRD